MSELHLVFAADERCVEGCAVAVRSAVESSTADRVHLHLVTSGLDEAQRDLLTRTADEAPRDTTVDFTEFDAAPVRHLLRSKLITHTAYARLFLAELLPGVERCIYLDCDLVVRRDLAELWATPLQGLTLGAVDNAAWQDPREHQARLGLARPRYFNSGVLLLDLARWRQREVGARALEVAGRLGDRLVLHDQDALNCALQEDWLSLPGHWNRWVIEPELRADAEVVFHYMGWPKPWHADYDRPHGALFFETLDRTPLRGWRPWNPLGLGRQAARLRRRFPFIPTVIRMVRNRMAGVH